MLTELTNASITLMASTMEARGAIWLEPEDAAAAKAWVETRFGAWDTLFRSIPRSSSPTWRGLLDLPYSVGEALRGETRGEAEATLSLGGSRSLAVLVPTNVSRGPARVGAMVVGRSAVGDTRGSWLVAVLGADVPPRQLGGTPSASADPTQLESGPLDPAGEQQLSLWSAQLAAGDPKAFATVVSDVFRRMRAIADDPIFDEVVRLHAEAAAASLGIVLAGVTGTIAKERIGGGRASFQTLLGELALLGVQVLNPQLSLVIRVGYLILKYMGSHS